MDNWIYKHCMPCKRANAQLGIFDFRRNETSGGGKYFGAGMFKTVN